MSKIKLFIKFQAEAQSSHRRARPRDAGWASNRLAIRRTARAALLLYAFSRDVAYTKLERRAHEPPPVWLAAKLSAELCEAPVTEGALSAWTTAAT